MEKCELYSGGNRTEQYKIFIEIVHLQSLQLDQLDPLSCSLCYFGEDVFFNFMEGSN